MTIQYSSFVSSVASGITSSDVGKILPSDKRTEAGIWYYEKSKDLILNYVFLESFIDKSFTYIFSFSITYFPVNSTTSVTEVKTFTLPAAENITISVSQEIDSTKAITVSDMVSTAATIAKENIAIGPYKNRSFKILYADRPADSPESVEEYPVIGMDTFSGEILTFNRQGEPNALFGPKLQLQTEIPPNDVNPQLVVAEKQFYKTRAGEKVFVDKPVGERFLVFPTINLPLFGEQFNFFTKYLVWKNGMKNTTSENPIQSRDDLVELWSYKEARKVVFYAIIPDGAEDPRLVIRETADNPSKAPKTWKFYLNRNEIAALGQGESIYEVHAGEILYFTKPGLAYTLTL